MIFSYKRNYIFIFLLLLLSFSSCDNESSRTKDEIIPGIRDIEGKAEQKNSTDTKNILLDEDSVKITKKVLIQTTMGNILIGLYGEDAPKTVKNFIGLVRKGYYNGILFHRVAKDFLIQAGDRNTHYPKKREEWGYGGKSFFGEPFEDELNPKTISYRIGYRPGVVAMANRGANTNTSQFFICLEDAKDLVKRWTIFGRVLEGMDVVRKINSVDIVPGLFEPNDGMPVKPVKIIRMRLKK